MKSQTKTDNHNLSAKLDLRRHFLRTYHADGGARVFDCCQATGRIWNELRRKHPIANYWGVDLKPKKGRLKVDSVRILDLPGWDFNVVDVDTYGSPWKHWAALLKNAPDALTVFLTIGLVKMAGVANYDRAILSMIGLEFKRLKLPQQIGVRIGERSIETCIAQAVHHGFKVVECQEVDNSTGHARYIGVRLERR